MKRLLVIGILLGAVGAGCSPEPTKTGIGAGTPTKPTETKPKSPPVDPG